MRAEFPVLDLFSGIGGFSLGLHWAGCTTIAFCETDPNCRAILARHWPGIPIHPDIRRLDATRLRPWLVCGGFPCQDISLAGPGAGLDGLRSSLWRPMLRIVAECRPRWVLLENVPGLRSRGADTIIAALAAIGYQSWPLVVGALHAGAPHRRRRLFLVARALATNSARPRLEMRHPGPPARPRLPPERRGRWPAEPAMARVAHGFPGRVDRVRALGNAVLPPIAAMLGRAIRRADALP